MKKVLVLTIFFLLVLPLKQANSANPGINAPRITSWYAAVVDYDSGRTLYEKCSNKVVPMASTTKIMTAIVALENSSLDDIVTISKRASSIHGSVIGLKQGQKLTMEELLYGLMLRSGNDCAIAIAEHVGGSVERFINMMNSKAFNIGTFDTHFRTPHGLDSDGHFTTAYDLALITRYAFKNSDFTRIVSTKDATLDGAEGTRIFHNINKMLWSLEGADGVKTGYTGKAGRCLVSSAYRNGKRVICVVLNSPNRWNDSKKLIEYGFKKYIDSIEINSLDYVKSLKVEGGRKGEFLAGFEGKISIPLSQEEKCNISCSIEIDENLSAPIYIGQQVGKLVLYSKGKQIYYIPYKSMEYVKAAG